MRLFTLVSLLAACETPVVDDKKQTGDTDDTGADTAASGSPYAGSYAGTIDGHAAFEADWETAPYCSGSVSVTVARGGELGGDGDCTILWGPYTGYDFAVTLGGTVDATGTVSIDSSLVDAEAEHPWDDTTLAGAFTEGVLSAEADTLYYPVGLDPIDAFIRVTAQ